MKSRINSIIIKLIFGSFLVISFFGITQKSFSQGFNNNEWVFGYCGSSQENSYLSFGKGEDPIVRTLPRTIVIGSENGNVDNNAVAVDPITGQVLFYTNGVLVYNYDNLQIQGAPNGVNGSSEVRQGAAIGTLDFEPDGDKLFYIFHISVTGQLQYSVVDMNASGGAVGNSPPLGAVTTLNQTIGNASGAIAVVKSAQSPSYLLSFEGGFLISRRIEPAEGDFTETDTQSLPFTPKAIIFDEERGQLILIPEDPNEDLMIVDYDTATGTFGSATVIPGSGGQDGIEGAAFSPDGTYLYFSKGDGLFRVPTSDLDAEPELIPIENDVFKIYDIKVGPDGRLYYIYEEVDGGPQLIGRVNNPDEEEIDELEVEEDPFNGVDFCGRAFPQFAPNQDIEPTVDFTWEPDEPCSNNPVQLTSLITPENYRPVSFEWTFNPPLTNEDGQPVEIDFNQEHLLIPEEATTNQSISVTLTVTFPDGTVRTVDKTITLKENDLQANFSTQDTTVCQGPCVDIGSLLEVQQGGSQGGENPNVGGGGQGGDYEYFWSNRRDEGWVTDKDNCVDLPGLYWVLVREPGSDCYAYAEIRVRIWDLPDQSNNIWLFGNGAGLDFNPDPDDPNAGIPRPVTPPHPQNIPAGTTTISDETGQVLFFTDGESVWDLNGDLMANGDNIGGNNQSSEGVIAVPVPQNQTVFYVFTTQRAADGSNQVKYSVVDIKTDNPTGVGNVVTKDNFLFSPSTEHSAALASGDTTWVLFHELGNNTFRAYPVSPFGIGQPVFSSVGSNHGFNTGVGSMKFSPDGSQVAVTIQDGNCSRLEIFNFNQSTGRLTEYALLDLGCNDDQIYGLEFSADGSRIFVSYLGNGGKIEEFLIKNPEAAGDDEDPDLSCGQCFTSARTRAARENCILNSSIRNVLTTDGPFGALQIASDGQIYVARPGQNSIPRIQAGANCEDSFYDDQGVGLAPGTTMNLGLPAFVQQSGSSIPEPAIAGPERLCLDPQVGALGLFEGGGEPDIDFYFWTIQHEDGQFDINDFGGDGEQFQNYEHVFTRPGLFEVTLRVDRCGDPNFYEESIEVLVVASPELTLPDEFTLCVGSPVSLTAIDGYDPSEGLYDFEWRNAAGQLIGDSTSNTIEVTEESIYTVTVSYRVPEGLTAAEFDICPSTKSVFVGPAFDFDLTQSAEEVCYDETLVVFAPNSPLLGQWFYQAEGSPDRVSLGEFFELELVPSSLPSPGLYEIIFVAEDPLIEGCLVEKRAELRVYPLPQVEIVILSDADDCDNPNGSFEITALTDIERLEILETGQIFGPLAAGEMLPVFTGLEPGLYTIQLTSDFGCEFVQTAVIQNLNPPLGLEGYEVSVSPEVCGVDGIEDGEIVLRFVNGPVSGTYQIIRQEDGLLFEGQFTNQDSVLLEVPAGTYAVEVRDANDCAFPQPDLYEVEERNLVDFSVPADVEACGSFVFSPQSESVLNFTLRDSNGTIINAEANGEFIITASGNYVLRGEDPDEIDCPRERTIIVTLSAPPVYELAGPRVDCDLGVYYEAVLGPGVNPNDVFIFWLNANREVVSRNPLFFPTQEGDYFLEVQPNSGALCAVDPIAFTVDDLAAQIEVELTSIPWCYDQELTLIFLNADLTNVALIEWFKVENGVTGPIPTDSDPNPLALTKGVEEPGIYRVVLTSVDGCIVGEAEIEIIQSFIEPPVLEPSYIICAPENEVPTIDPGEYGFYSWILDGEVVSEERIFVPTLAGTYQLVVSDVAGCSFEVEFTVEEDCEIRVIFPNAMIINESNKNFVVYTSDFVDQLEVFIYNRWGELIYYCENSGSNSETAQCAWDGTVNGKFVPIGTYAVVVRYGSTRQNIFRTLKKSITVLE